MSWRTAHALLQEIGTGRPEDPLKAAEQVRWLGRYGTTAELERLTDTLRRSALWGPQLALEVGVAHLLAGQGARADDALLEADALAPSLELVPDPWGLWPQPEGHAVCDPPLAIASLLSRFHLWRWLDPNALWKNWLPGFREHWPSVLEGQDLDDLALLLRHESRLSESLESTLASVVSEVEIEAHPAQAQRFWGFVCDNRPGWSYARLKAADLALQCADPEQCGLWLAAASAEQRTSPWLADIAARHALDSGEVTRALEAWGEAISLATEEPDLVELFRQRRRDARRGPGVMQARALINQGASGEARVLLEQLLEQDPQWQPLRSLIDQLPTDAACGGEGDLERFAALIQRAAGRWGVELPSLPSPASAEDHAADLNRFVAALAAAEGRFALVA